MSILLIQYLIFITVPILSRFLFYFQSVTRLLWVCDQCWHIDIPYHQPIHWPFLSSEELTYKVFYKVPSQYHPPHPSCLTSDPTHNFLLMSFRSVSADSTPPLQLLPHPPHPLSSVSLFVVFSCFSFWLLQK